MLAKVYSAPLCAFHRRTVRAAFASHEIRQQRRHLGQRKKTDVANVRRALTQLDAHDNTLTCFPLARSFRNREEGDEKGHTKKMEKSLGVCTFMVPLCLKCLINGAQAFRALPASQLTHDLFESSGQSITNLPTFSPVSCVNLAIDEFI